MDGLIFNTSQFSENALGTPGTAKRRFFYGPGLENYDMALLKNVRLTESKSLQFRLEGFNVFNHAQFFGPQSVDGNIGSSTFGQVVSANPPASFSWAQNSFSSARDSPPTTLDHSMPYNCCDK